MGRRGRGGRGGMCVTREVWSCVVRRIVVYALHDPHTKGQCGQYNDQRAAPPAPFKVQI